ncbi:hypothetical protein AALP_AA5G206900 [Arabis alpina]|uniref:Uncharacterized protein n=1 Tax=Arabis alpina TaxID=50452 RepID=A0A087GYD9_ARAAL|nr:hypothetical protein AALP_AA5G206900 [Arabis alpina]
MADEKKPRTSRFKIDNLPSRVKEEDDENKKETSMRKSWSTNSLGLLNNSNRSGKKTCVCAPTKHEGSFRCRLHRSSTTSHHNAAATTTQLHLPKPLLPSRYLNDQ